MQASNALHTFQEFLTESGLSLDTLTPNQATERMIQFYEQLRADECDINSDADMLLFQWGVYDWGAGAFFEYNITRQLIYSEMIPADPELPDDEEGEEEIFGQLSLTLKYAPVAELQAITSGNRWCHDLTDLSTFTTFRDYQKINAVATIRIAFIVNRRSIRRIAAIFIMLSLDPVVRSYSLLNRRC